MVFPVPGGMGSRPPGRQQDRSWTVFPRPMSSARMAPTPSRPRNDSHDSPRCWYGRSVPSKPSGVSIGSSRWSAWPDSRSPSHPSASTAVSGSSLRSPSAPIAAPSTSAAVIVPDCLPSRNFSAAFRCRSSSSTHWPRTRTSGTLSLASSASSSGDSTSSPTARSYRKDTRSCRPNWLCLAEADEPADDDRVVSLRPSRALRAQSGSSTPNPAPDSSGPVSRRNSSAPAVSSATWAGAASRSAPSSAGNSRAAAPSPASSSSSGCPAFCRVVPASQPYPVPVHTSAAGSIRLGSSADCSENSTRQPSSAPGPSAVSDGSTSRKQVRTEPPGARRWPASPRTRSQLPGLALVLRGRHLDERIRGRQRYGPFQHGNAGGGATAARGQQGTGQPGAHRRIR